MSDDIFAGLPPLTGLEKLTPADVDKAFAEGGVSASEKDALVAQLEDLTARADSDSELIAGVLKGAALIVKILAVV